MSFDLASRFLMPGLPDLVLGVASLGGLEVVFRYQGPSRFLTTYGWETS